MRHRLLPWLAATLPLMMWACSGGSVATTTTASVETSEELFEDFASATFGSSTEIDNQWWPLAPGTQFVYEGVTRIDGEEIPHRLISTITDLTKVIGDVRTVVLWEEDYQDGVLLEAELAFFAQDDGGNIWHLGQYPEEYEEGEIVATPSWIAGVEEARAGIFMPSDPRPETPSYSQGWGPAVEWYDRAQVFEAGQSTCVAAGCYEEVLLIDEFDLVEPNFFQVKYYAPGVGIVKVGWKGPDPEQEELELVEVIQLNAEGLAEARASALELETRAYELSKNVYGTTDPAE